MQTPLSSSLPVEQRSGGVRPAADASGRETRAQQELPRKRTIEVKEFRPNSATGPSGYFPQTQIPNPLYLRRCALLLCCRRAACCSRLAQHRLPQPPHAALRRRTVAVRCARCAPGGQPGAGQAGCSMEEEEEEEDLLDGGRLLDGAGQDRTSTSTNRTSSVIIFTLNNSFMNYTLSHQLSH